MANNHIEEVIEDWIDGWEKVRALVSEEMFDSIKQYKEEDGILYGWIYTNHPHGKWIELTKTNNNMEVNMKELIEKYPKTGQLIIGKVREFINILQKEMMNDIPPEQLGTTELPEIDDGIISDFINENIGKGSNQSMLFDLFDSQGIYMSVYYSDSSDAWIYHLNSSEHSSSASSRKEGIQNIIPMAFEALETKLNTNNGTFSKS